MWVHDKAVDDEYASIYYVMCNFMYSHDIIYAILNLICLAKSVCVFCLCAKDRGAQ